jgi:hypothetical protein
MSERLKRLLLIVGFLVVTAGLAFLLYWMFFRVPPEELPPPVAPEAFEGVFPRAGEAPPPAPVAPPVAPGLPVAPELPAPPAPPGPPPRTRVLRTEVTSAISLSPSGIRSYNPNDGKFYRVQDDGTAVPMSNQVFFNVDEVTWGNRTDKAVLTYPDGSKILYDFTTDRQATLPRHWDGFSFSPQDDKIVTKAVGNSPENRFLVVANPDGTNARLIEELGENQDKVMVNWSPNDQVVAFAQTGSPLGFDRQEILLIGKNQENFKGLIVEGRGFMPQWSPSGQNLIYSVYNTAEGFRPTIWFSGAVGDDVNANRRNLGLKTWADKCTWQNETTAYCAVPEELGEGAALQRGLFANVPDDIYRVDLQAGTTVNLGRPDGNPSINKLLTSPDGSAVYFTDRLTGQLVRFEL